MNQSPSLANLHESLVPFTAHPVASSVIWCAPDIDDNKKLHESCSYMVNPDATGTGKTFLAERYGGSGLQRNGGGARCGFDGQYQVKGIGANPLVGEGTDRHHSNGALTANQAVYEALWGEILTQSLPYGAVRTRAVLLTENYIDLQFERVTGNSRRALLVREPVIRPAHFERAPYFRPQTEYARLLMHDANRVRWVIRQLPASLPTPSTGFSIEALRDPRQYCLEGLCELTRRQAKQMAFCQTRFLMLTTSPSNIAIDGRVLDFNGLNCLFPSDHRYDFEYQLKFTQLMKEPVVLQQGVSDLCLYLGKYLFDRDFTLHAQKQTEACFRQTFREECCRGYLEVLGIPVAFLSPIETPLILEQLVNSFIHLITRYSRTLYCPPDSAKNESQLERLVMVLIQLSQGQTPPDHDDFFGDTRFTETLRTFTEANHWLVKSCRDQGLDVIAIQKNMKVQARQKLQPRACLGKVRMLNEISALLEKYADNNRLLQQALYDMELKTLAFAKEAFGSQSPFHYIARGYEKV